MYLKELTLEEFNALADNNGFWEKKINEIIQIEGWDYLSTEDNVKVYHKKLKLMEEFYQDIEKYFDETYVNYFSEKRLLTGEYTPFYLLLNKIDGKWKLTGVIDFADCFIGDPFYDLLGPILFMFNIEKGLVKDFLRSYGYEDHQLNESLQKKLMIYTILHRFSNINYYISRKKRNNY